MFTIVLKARLPALQVLDSWMAETNRFSTCVNPTSSNLAPQPTDSERTSIYWTSELTWIHCGFISYSIGNRESSLLRNKGHLKRDWASRHRHSNSHYACFRLRCPLRSAVGRTDRMAMTKFDRWRVLPGSGICVGSKIADPALCNRFVCHCVMATYFFLQEWYTATTKVGWRISAFRRCSWECSRCGFLCAYDFRPQAVLCL
jgi:hypothetical protein